MEGRFARLAITTVVVTVGLLIFYISKQADSPAPTTQTPAIQSSDVAEEQQNVVEPDVNNLEFRLISANIQCASNESSESPARLCDGNIRVIPRAQADMDPGLYKINVQTKLIHNGQEEDLHNLRQLADMQTIVRLRLVEGDAGLLSEISY